MPKHYHSVLKRPWTEAEDFTLREEYPLLGRYILAEKLGRTPNAVRCRAVKLHTRQCVDPRLWTPAEDAILEANWVKGGAVYCSKVIGRTVKSVRNRAHRLGLPGFSRSQYKPIEKEDSGTRSWLAIGREIDISREQARQDFLNATKKIRVGFRMCGIDPDEGMLMALHYLIVQSEVARWCRGANAWCDYMEKLMQEEAA